MICICGRMQLYGYNASWKWHGECSVFCAFSRLCIGLFILWSIFWKGLALWHSARRGETVWFIILLVVNTAGILELIYLFLVKKIKPADLFTDMKKKKK